MHIGRLCLCAAMLLGWGATSRATTVIQPTFGRMVGSSDYIVRAVVKSVTAEWRENPAVAGQRYIVSLVELDVRDVIKGSPPTPLILQVMGGRIGEEELVVEGAPKFHVGDENILFVRGNGRSFFPVVGLMHGYFSVKREPRTGRAQVARHDGRLLSSESELEPGAPTATRATPLTPEEFRARIQAKAAGSLP